MKMLVLILNDEEKVDEVLLGLSEVGVKGATVIESTGMGSILGIKLPFFSRKDNVVRIQKPDNKTIFAVINNDWILKKAINMLKEKLRIERPGTGFIFVVPVLEAYGTPEILDEED